MIKDDTQDSPLITRRSVIGLGSLGFIGGLILTILYCILQVLVGKPIASGGILPNFLLGIKAGILYGMLGGYSTIMVYIGYKAIKYILDNGLPQDEREDSNDL